MRKKVFHYAVAVFTAAIIMAGHQQASALGGFGVHGGFVTGYKNLTLQESVRNAYRDVLAFNLSGDMKTVGAHIDVISLMVVGCDLSLDYAWKTQTFLRNVDLRYSTLSASGGVKVSLPSLISPYVGAGLGVYRSAFSISANTITVVLPSDKTNFGWLARAGIAINIPVFPVKPFIEWKYTEIQTKDNPTKYHSILLGATLKIL